MAQIQTKFIATKAVTAVKLGSGAATSVQPLFADGSGGASYRSILSTDIPTLNQNTTGTAANITASSNSTLTTLSALSLPGSQVTGNISGNAANVTGIVAIANGGTGQPTAAAAFNALSPLTTAGDLIYENATPAPGRLGIGSTGQVLTVVGGLPVWQTPSISPGDITLTDNHIFVGNASNLATDVAMSGDATIVASGALTLATVNSNVGSFGSSTSIPSFTVNAKGLITAASGNAVVAPAGTLSGTTLNSTVVSSSLTSVGTIATGVWNGTAIGPTFGGTGETSYTTGDTLYASATNVLAKLPVGSTGQVLTVVAGIPAWSNTAATSTNNKETFILASGDITNQFVTLAHTPIANSTDLLVQGGGVQLEGSSYDYVISGAQVQFKNGLATGGVSALVAGDILQVQYEF